MMPQNSAPMISSKDSFKFISETLYLRENHRWRWRFLALSRSTEFLRAAFLVILGRPDRYINEKENGTRPFSMGWDALGFNVQCGLIVVSCLFHYPDIVGGGIFPSGFIVNIHPTSAHTLDIDCLAIHVDVIGIDRRQRHTGGRALAPPLN